MSNDRLRLQAYNTVSMSSSCIHQRKTITLHDCKYTKNNLNSNFLLNYFIQQENIWTYRGHSFTG